MKYFFLILFYILCFCSLVAQDTSNLNNLTNKAIVKSIESKPSNIDIEFLKNGKKIIKGYKFFAYCREKIIARTNNNVLVLNLKQMQDVDTLYFILDYKGTKIISKKYNYKNLLHGGKFIGGLASKFFDLRNKYLSDSALFIQNNRKSYLYYFINKKMENLNRIWASSDLEGKRTLHKILFPEGIFYDAQNHQYLTRKTNQFVELVSSISTIYDEKRIGNLQNNIENSRPVSGSRELSNQIMEDFIKFTNL